MSLFLVSFAGAFVGFVVGAGVVFWLVVVGLESMFKR